MKLEEALLAVWRQALEENANLVELEGRRFPVLRTRRRRLRQVDFVFAGESLRGIEQNPETSSRWAALARAGQKVMQFTSAPPGATSGRYLANVADGKLTFYGKSGAGARKPSQKPR